MDDATRGFVESVIDGILKEEILKDIEWIKNEMPISSMNDLAIGYLCGILDAFAVTVVSARATKGVPKKRYASTPRNGKAKTSRDYRENQQRTERVVTLLLSPLSFYDACKEND